MHRLLRSRWPSFRSHATDVVIGLALAYGLAVALDAQRTGSGVQPAGGLVAGAAQLAGLTNSFVSAVTTQSGGLSVTGTGVTSGRVVSITGSTATPGADTATVGTGSGLHLTGNLGSTYTGATPRTALVYSDATINTATSDAKNANLQLLTTVANTVAFARSWGIHTRMTDSTTLANWLYGIDSDVTTSGNSNKTVTAVQGSANSSSTTFNTMYGMRANGTNSGAVASGTQLTAGLYSTAVSLNLAGGTANVYAGYFQGGGSVASGTINSYGVYIANPASMNATGTSQNVGLFVEPPTGADTNVAILVDTGGRTRLLGPLEVGTALTFSPTAPTVTSAGTSPSVVANGTAAFRVGVGTGGTATTIVMAMPAATTGWNCFAENITATAANRANQRVVLQSSTTTAVTFQNQTISTGAALAFTASDIVAVICAGY